MHSPELESNRHQKSQKLVPKFSSFRPSQPETKNETAAQITVQEVDSKKAKRSDVSPTSRKRKWKSEDPAEQRSLLSGRPGHQDLSLGHEYGRPAPPDSGSEFFVSDRTGDPKNVVFGALDRYSVPLYRRNGAGAVLGATSDQRIDSSVSSDKSIILLASSRFKDQSKRPLRTLQPQRLQEQTIQHRSTVNNDADLSLDILPLKPSRTVARRDKHSKTTPSDSEEELSPDEDDSDDQQLGVRSLKIKRFAESGGNDAVDSHEPQSSRLVRQRISDLNAAVEQKPGDGQAWLELIGGQDLFLDLDSSNAARQSTADIKVSLYEKALSAVSANDLRQLLLFGLLDEGAKIWEASRLGAEWKKALRRYSQSTALWMKYLDYRQNDFPSFKYENFQTICTECLDILRGSAVKASSSLEQDQLYQSQIFVVVRATTSMRDSGFTEHAFAIWQSLLEFELLAPPHLQGELHASAEKLQRKTASFEKFWESEASRLGEDGAGGWMAYDSGERKSLNPQTFGHRREIASHDPFAAWTLAEEAGAVSSHLPARSIDDVPENDPFKVILFDDIRPYLVSAPSKKAKDLLLDSFLCFYDLPLSNSKPMVRKWSRYGFLQSKGFGYEAMHSATDDTKLSEDPSANPISHSENGSTESPFKFQLPDYQVDATTLFSADGLWFQAFDNKKARKDAPISPLVAAWCLQALKTIALAQGTDDGLAEYTLAFEASRSLQSAKKTARKFLKNQSSSLRLYNAYALIEYRLGNHGQGDHTLLTAINMVAKIDEGRRKDSILLWRSWVWELLDQSKTTEALSRLQLYSGDNTEIGHEIVSLEASHGLNPSKVLRSRSALAAFRDHMLTQKFFYHASLAMECLVLLDYMSNESSLQASLLVFSANISMLMDYDDPSAIAAQESLHQSTSRLLYFHITHSTAFQPSLIRNFFFESITKFPYNTIFLSLYAWNERRFRIHDRLRSILDSIILHPSASAPPPSLDPSSSSNKKPFSSSPSSKPALASTSSTSTKDPNATTPFLFALSTELTRRLNAGSNIHTIRATFERTVADTAPGAHCPGIWKSYFWYEYARVGDLKRAKDVAFRGIRACPWCKDLYMLVFRHLWRPPLAVADDDAGEGGPTGRAGAGAGNEHGDGDTAKGSGRDKIRGGGGVEKQKKKAKEQSSSPPLLTEADLRGVYDLMVSKELRIHVDLDDLQEEWEDRAHTSDA